MLLCGHLETDRPVLEQNETEGDLSPKMPHDNGQTKGKYLRTIRTRTDKCFLMESSASMKARFHLYTYLVGKPATDCR